jgi:demethylmenaquinone methyltransferase/2-methoxy-6-polyprenyl-1,4-benzoquinol methylase
MDLREVYSRIPRSYEKTNHILTLGLDTVWRRAAAADAVRAARFLPGTGHGRWLDLCSGTGEMAGLLSRRAPEEVTVICADFSTAMLREGIRRRGRGRIVRTAASADHLPFDDSSFGLVSVAFAARNLRSRQGLFGSSLREIRRVLEPGGVFINIETSQPSSAPVRAILHSYAAGAVGRLGTILTGEREGYEYLSGSIRSFPGPSELAAEIEDAGFSHVVWRSLTLGVVAIHTATA